jgi:uncharacterized DUF497 family protein
MRRILWDENKDAINRQKHRVSFPEASEVFFDPLLVTVADHRQEADELRFFSLGEIRANACLRLRIQKRLNLLELLPHEMPPLRRGEAMKKVNDEEHDDDIPDEIDFSGGVRGKYAGSIEPLNNLILIDPELFETFPSAEAVNEALRLLKKASTEATAAGKRHDRARAS